ncbi:MAG TPA: sigma-70 family RNA polymerase sigma factor [Myxococcaceae bacterium]
MRRIYVESAAGLGSDGALAGERLDELVARLYPQVLRSARRMYPGDAEDLVQHAFTTFTARFPAEAFPTSHGCLAYLGKVMHNAFLSTVRKQRIQRRGSADPALRRELEPAPLDPRPLQPFETVTDEEWRSAVGSLSGKQREVYELSLGDKSYAQIAGELGVRPGAVAKRLYDARRKLERSLREVLERREEH